METREVHYKQHVFLFEYSSNEIFEGRLLLDEAQREMLKRLLTEEEEWGLDEYGERLPAEQLFEFRRGVIQAQADPSKF